MAVGNLWPALTPGGRPGPSPRQGQRCGAVPRNGLQGPRTKRPHWGRRASGRRPGRDFTFWGPSGYSLSARTLFRGEPPLVNVGCWILPKSLLQSRSPHLSLFPPAPLGGPRNPPSQRAAPAQSRAGGGEGPVGVHSRGSRAPTRQSPARARASSRAAQLQPKSWAPAVL